MLIRHKTILKILLLPVALILGLELLLQLGALIVAATGREMPTGWSTEHTRVLALGDSNTFGIYLNEDESYPSQLEALWNARHPDNPIEVLNLGYPGTNSYRAADTLEDIINTFKPDIVLLTIGVNDKFTASEFVETNADVSSDAVIWEPMAILRRYSRLYKLAYIASQGKAATDNMTESTSGSLVESGEAMVKSRDILTWSDDPKERWDNIFLFKVANSEATEGSSGLAETVTYGDKKFVMVTEKENSNTPGKEKGFRYLQQNLASIEQKVEGSGADFYLLTYAASAGFYAPTNVQLRTYVENNSTVRFIDVATEFAKDCSKSADCADLFFQDYHPKAKGYEKVALIVAEALEGNERFSE
jgi:lysophospholipase L1-like esterase